MKNFKQLILAIICLFAHLEGVMAQEDSTDLMDDLFDLPEPELPKYVSASFKTTRVINGHSIENPHHGVLEFRIAHRFGTVQRGVYDLFGLDQASMKMNFDYGVTDRIAVGLARSTYQKTYDGFVKTQLLKQRTDNKVPLTVVWVSGMSVNTLDWAEPERQNFVSSRFSYFHQILLARKFSDKFTLQLSPTLVHRNLVADNRVETNDVYALGIGLRQKLSNRVSVNLEHYYVLSKPFPETFKPSLSVGVDIETGGHVFQLHFTNSTAMVEKSFIAETQHSWLAGGIHFGFNVSRVFTLRSY